MIPNTCTVQQPPGRAHSDSRAAAALSLSAVQCPGSAGGSSEAPPGFLTCQVNCENMRVDWRLYRPVQFVVKLTADWAVQMLGIGRV